MFMSIRGEKIFTEFSNIDCLFRSVGFKYWPMEKFSLVLGKNKKIHSKFLTNVDLNLKNYILLYYDLPYFLYERMVLIGGKFFKYPQSI